MKKDFIEFLIGAGALRFGDFTLKSGRRSPYFINAGAFDTGGKIDRLGYFYAKHIAALVKDGELPGDIATIFGPAYKGIPIATATAASLSRDFRDVISGDSGDSGDNGDRGDRGDSGDRGDRGDNGDNGDSGDSRDRGNSGDIGYTFNRKEAKDHGEGGNFIGKKMKDGDKIIIVDDVITAGTAVREIVPLVKSEADVTIAGLVLSADRMERGKGTDGGKDSGVGSVSNGVSAVEEVRREFGIPVFPIVNVRDIFAMASGMPGLFARWDAAGGEADPRNAMDAVANSHVIAGFAAGSAPDAIPDELPCSMTDEIDGKLIRRAIAYMDEYCLW